MNLSCKEILYYSTTEGSEAVFKYCPYCNGTGVIATYITTQTVYCSACPAGEQKSINAGVGKTLRFHKPKFNDE